MIETRHQAPGRFTIELDNPPERVRELTARFHAAVIVLPGKVNHPEKMTLAALYAAAQYVGIHTGREDSRCTLNGYGPAYLLTLARQPSEQTIPKRPLYNGTSNNSWVRNSVLRVGVSESNGITAGPIMTAAAASTPTKAGKIPAGQEPLETLGDVARRFGKEWTCDKGVLEVAARSSLFAVTPTCVAAVKSSGSDLNVDGLEVVEFSERDDVDDFATEVAVPFTPDDFAYSVAYEVGDTVVVADGTFYECTTAHTSSGANQPPSSKWSAVDPYGVATTSSVPYVNPFDGTELVARRVMQARNATTYDDATDIATNQLARFDDVQRHITLSSDDFHIDGKVKAGDNIYAFDPGNDLVGSSQVPFRGRVLPCATVRVRAVREAVDARKQVLLYSWDGSAQVLDDVTPWVAFEERGQTLELGEPRRRRPTSAVAV